MASPLQGEIAIQAGPQAVAFFQEYLKRPIDATAFQNRMEEFRQRASNVKAYRCIVEGRFFVPRCTLHPQYSLIKGTLANKRLIDIGCALGTDARKFLLDGLQLSNLTCIDLENEFWSLGLELFEDKDKELGHSNVFHQRDFLKPDFLSSLPHKDYDVLYLGAVLHLLQEADIKKLLSIAATLLRERHGVLFGRTVANVTPGIASWNGSVSAGRFTMQLKGSGPEDKSNVSAVASASDQPSAPPSANPTQDSAGPRLRFLHSPESLKQVLQEAGFGNVQTSWFQGAKPENTYGIVDFYGEMP